MGGRLVCHPPNSRPGPVPLPFRLSVLTCKMGMINVSTCKVTVGEDSASQAVLAVILTVVLTNRGCPDRALGRGEAE